MSEREKPMSFTDVRGRSRRVRLGKHVEFDAQERRWTSSPIVVYVATKAMEVK